jgi:hypothetical protein
MVSVSRIPSSMPVTGADRDGHFLAAPQVPLLEEHVGHGVVFRVDDEPLDFSDVVVGGMDVLAATHLHLGTTVNHARFRSDPGGGMLLITLRHQPSPGATREYPPY